MLTPTEASRAPYEGDASIPRYVELLRPREERGIRPCLPTAQHLVEGVPVHHTPLQQLFPEGSLGEQLGLASCWGVDSAVTDVAPILTV